MSVPNFLIIGRPGAAQLRSTPLGPRLRCELTDRFREEIANLQILAGLDLADWFVEPSET